MYRIKEISIPNRPKPGRSEDHEVGAEGSPPRLWVILPSESKAGGPAEYIVRPGWVAHWEPTRLALRFEDVEDAPYLWFRREDELFRTEEEARASLHRA